MFVPYFSCACDLYLFFTLLQVIKAITNITKAVTRIINTIMCLRIFKGLPQGIQILY